MADEKPTVDQLRALGAALPPSHRLHGSEVADVLSALTAVVTHGREILKAAEDGSAGVLDFLHGHVTDNRPEGADEPVRGQVATVTPAASPAVAVGSQQIDYNELAAAIVRAQNEQSSPVQGPDTPPDRSASTEPASVTESEPTREGVAATSDHPAGAPGREAVTDPAPSTDVTPPVNEPPAPSSGSEGTGIL